MKPSAVAKRLPSTTTLRAAPPISSVAHAGAVSPSAAPFVAVSRVTFWICWWFVLLVHLGVALFTAGAALVHLVLSLPQVQATTNGLQLSASLLRISGASYAVVAMLHAIAIARQLMASCGRSGLELRFHRDRRAALVDHRRSLFPMERLTKWPRLVVAALFSSTGWFGIHSTVFSRTLLFREATEVLLQSYQLWSLSAAVAKPWIHAFAVTVVCLNCWSLSVVDVLTSHLPETRRRLAHLVVDMCLDMAISVVVPVWILIPSVLAFDWRGGFFPYDLILDDVWYVAGVLEARQVLVTSRLDFVASLLPQYSVFSCLRTLKRLIRRAPAGVAPCDKPSMPTVSVTTRSTDRGGPSHWKTVKRVIGACVALWSVAIVGLSLDANLSTRHATSPGCVLYQRPWLPTQVCCSVLHIHCHRAGIDGTAHEIAAFFTPLDASCLRKITFIYCPALTIPEEIQRLSSLQMLDFHNVSLVSWSRQAALTQATHPAVTGVYFRASRVDTIPDGLLHSELPHALTELAYYNCTLSYLPESIGEHWASTRLSQLRFESTLLTTLPVSLYKAPLIRLWITSNRLEELPANLFHGSKLRSVHLSGNPLTRLPSDVRDEDVSQLTELLLEHTNVPALPTWTSRLVETARNPSHVSLFGSPICDALPTGTSTVGAAIAAACARDQESQYGSVPYHLTRDRYPL